MPTILHLMFRNKCIALTGVEPNTVAFLYVLLDEAGVEAVQQRHQKGQIHWVQGAVRLNCHSFQVSDKEQGVVFA